VFRKSLIMKATLLYIIDPDTFEVLLATKGRGVGAGFLFGYGGKLEDEDGGDMKKCTIREFKDESGGVSIEKYYEKLEPMALIRFFRGEDKNPLIDEPSFEVLCFRLFASSSEFVKVIDTDEMEQPTWFKINDIPFNNPTKMKPGDELFVPHVISGNTVKGYIWFEKETNKVIGSQIDFCTKEALLA